MQQNLFEGWDFDGTICHSPNGVGLKIFRFIESFCPFITLIRRVKLKPTNPNILIITASSNKVGIIAWLKLHGIKYHSIIFVRDFKDKEYFINKLCRRYIEIE